MKRVTGFVSFHSSKKRQANERQIADQIERLVAAEFVRKAQRAIHDAIVGKDNGVIERAAADQAHGAQGLDVALKTKSSCASEQLPEGLREHDHFNLLLTYERMRKVHVTLDAKFVGRIDADAAILFYHFYGFNNLEVAAATTQAADAGLFEKLEKRFSGTIEDGDFDRVDVNKDVVDARRIDRGEKMFGRGEKDALLHQAGGVTDASYVAAAGLDGKIVQIGTTKDDASVGWGGKESNMAKNSGVKADAFGRNFMLNGSLKHWDSE